MVHVLFQYGPELDCGLDGFAFAQISQGQQPNPVTGKILDYSTPLLGNQCNISSGDWCTGPVTTPAVATSLSTVTSAFLEVALTNTSQQPAGFTVCALYSDSITAHRRACQWSLSRKRT